MVKVFFGDQIRDVFGAHVNPTPVLFDVEVDSEAIYVTDARLFAFLHRVCHCDINATDSVLLGRLFEDILALCGQGHEIIIIILAQ